MLLSSRCYECCASVCRTPTRVPTRSSTIVRRRTSAPGFVELSTVCWSACRSRRRPSTAARGTGTQVARTRSTWLSACRHDHPPPCLPCACETLGEMTSLTPSHVLVLLLYFRCLLLFFVVIARDSAAETCNVIYCYMKSVRPSYNPRCTALLTSFS